MITFREISREKVEQYRFTCFPCGLLTLRVHLLGNLEGIGVGQVSVGRGDGQDQTALLGDELHQHFPDLVLDVMGLVSHGHFGHPGQVDQGQVQH